MNLPYRYKRVISFQVSKPKVTAYSEVILASKGLAIDEDTIHIIIKPDFFDPFAGRGIINLQLSEIEPNTKTQVRCEMTPTSITKRGLYTLASLLLIWTIIGLAISNTFYSFLTIVFGWTAVSLVVHVTQVINRGKLESHARYIFSTIQKLKTKSIA